MKNNPHTRAFALAAFAAAATLAGASASAQQQAANVTVAPAVVVTHVKPKLDKYRGRVLAFNMAALIVQDMENPRMVRSFQYSTELHSKVADMLGSGSFQPGDKITVYCNPGTTVAVKIKGKPSQSN